MYDVAAYQALIDDPVRMDAYASALQHAVTAGSVVVDIGAGTGVMSLLACRFGARRVYAIEPDNVIHIARQNAAANNLADRIEFIQDLSTNVNLPLRADVVVSDLRGILPLFQKHIPSIVHAREHLLASGGVLIPGEDSLWMAVTEEPERTGHFSDRWDPGQYGLRLEGERRYLKNLMYKTRVGIDRLLTKPKCWAQLNYRNILSPNIEAEFDLPVLRDGLAYGIVAWFDTVLLDEIGFSNAPGEREAVYGRMLFPLAEPTEVRRGDTITVALRASLTGGDYTWQWETRVRTPNAPGSPRLIGQQSSFFAQPLPMQSLQKQSRRLPPHPQREGRSGSIRPRADARPPHTE